VKTSIKEGPRVLNRRGAVTHHIVSVHEDHYRLEPRVKRSGGRGVTGRTAPARCTAAVNATHGTVTDVRYQG